MDFKLDLKISRISFHFWFDLAIQLLPFVVTKGRHLGAFLFISYLYEKELLSGPYHAFGIIEKVEQSKDYEKYEPDKYNVIKFPDNLIDKWFPEIWNLSVYFHKLSRPEKGLARHGITLIPPESLDMLYNIVDKKTFYVYETNILNAFEPKTKLLEMILKASDEKKFIIHFGV